LQPIRCVVVAAGAQAAEQAEGAPAQEEHEEDQLLASFRAYLAAFYHGTAARLLPPLTVRIDPATGRGTLLGSRCAGATTARAPGRPWRTGSSTRARCSRL
jgi:hypothetical protein